ncbi:MAG TPA: NADP-dependent oxidoreductase [Paludibacter sp.]|nr:NADP-dependent oxidoreductase [Paludibacter sp.]
MKTVRIHEYGNVDVLHMEDMPIPQIGADELLIKIHAASVNPVDWKVREGWMKEMRIHKLPLTLGQDFSGTVEKTGKNVKGFNVGDYVYGRSSIERDGTYAEYIEVKANEVALMPKSTNFNEAAGIPLVGTTAWETLINRARIKKGQRVLILAASGGVGSLAVQIAKAKGCYVIGTTSKVNIELVKSLGADEVIDYLNEDFSTKLKDIDVVLDTIGGDIQKKAFNVIKRGGTLVTTSNPPDQELAQRYGVRAESVFVGPNAHILNELRKYIDAGLIRPVVDKVYKFEDVKLAQNYSQSGKARGKIILEIGN